MMSPRTRRTAGILFLTFPVVLVGGLVLISDVEGLINLDVNPLKKDFFRFGFTLAWLILLLSFIMLRYVDDALLPERMRNWVRLSAPVSAFLVTAGFFLSVLPVGRPEPNGLVFLIYLGGAVLIAGIVMLGVGFVRN